MGREVPTEDVMAKRFCLSLGLAFSSSVAAWEGRIFSIDGKIITVATTDSSKLNVGAALQILQNGKIVGHGKVTKIFHSKVEMTLTNGLVAVDFIVSDENTRPKGNYSGSATKSLLIAVENGNIEEVKNALDNRADANVKNRNGASVLYIAANQGRTEIVKLLVDAGANVEFKFHDGNVSSLQRASWFGYTGIVKLLIDAKADVQAKNNEGDTSLQWAAAAGRTEVVKLLIEAKAEVNLKNKDGYAPLYLAAQRGHVEIVKMLIEAHGDVNEMNDRRVTILHWVAMNGDAAIVKLLLQASADPNIPDVGGRTARFSAKQNDHAEVVGFLKAAGAEE